MINKCIKKLSITFLFLISFFIICGCFACNQFYSEKQKGYISISLNEETPLLKTILPEENPYQNMLGLSWTISCKKVDSGTDSEIFTRTWSDKTNDSLESDAGEIGSVISAYSQMITDSFSIDLGNYNFELVAKLENEAVLTASKTEEIVAGSQTLVFKMEEASGENVAKGKIDFTLNFPENIVHNVEAALYKWESSNFVENGSYLFSKNTENPQTLNTFNYEQDSIDSGFYLLKILFKQDIGINTTSYKTIYTYTSLVRIAPGLTSSKTVTLNTLPKLYKISYVDNDGTTELCPTEFYNQFTSFNLPTPEEKENMTFLGWFLDNGQNTPVELDDNEKFHISEDTTLYAGWESSVVYEDGITYEITEEKTILYISNENGLKLFRDIINGSLNETINVKSKSKSNEYISFEQGYSNNSINCILTNDIILTEEWIPIGTETNPYSGTLDGSGFCILEMKITNELVNPGFFSFLNGSEIKNICIQGEINFIGTQVASYIGGFASKSYNTIFSNCINNIEVNYTNYGYSYIGGFVGIIENTNFVACINMANITASEICGGFIGKAETGENSFLQCINIGNINGNNHVAGFVGYNTDVIFNVKNCINLGEIGNQDENSTYISGILSPGGTSEFTKDQFIENCLSIGKLKGGTYLYPTSSNTNTKITNNFYDTTINNIKTDYNSQGKSTTELVVATPYGETWTEENWSFAEGRYPLPNISAKIPKGENGDYWQYILQVATPKQ